MLYNIKPFKSLQRKTLQEKGLTSNHICKKKFFIKQFIKLKKICAFVPRLTLNCVFKHLYTV